MAAFTMETVSKTDSEVVIRCDFAVSREKVFRAWTEPKWMVRWMCPSPTAEVILDEFNLVVGGRYSLAMHVKGGPQIVVGEYLEIDPPARLVLTWQWATNDSTPEPTVVEVDLEDVEGGCRMTLRHSRFAHRDVCDGHLEGWQLCVARLNEAL